MRIQLDRMSVGVSMATKRTQPLTLVKVSENVTSLILLTVAITLKEHAGSTQTLDS